MAIKKWMMYHPQISVIGTPMMKSAQVTLHKMAYRSLSLAYCIGTFAETMHDQTVQASANIWNSTQNVNKLEPNKRNLNLGQPR